MSSSNGPVLILASAVLAALLLTASVYDVRSRRVPNALVLAIVSAGVVFSASCKGLLGVGVSLAYMAVGLLIWLPFYAFRMMGAGDVKLFAAGCAWLASISDVLVAAGATAIVGGVLAILWALMQRRLFSMVASLLTTIRFRVPVAFDTHATKLPYGIAMGVGLLWTFTRGVA